ncbi:MAG: class I SAM-dependent methyltransferase [Gemmataceae bacterium]
MNEARIHETPADAVAERVREKVIVEKRVFWLDRPAGLDRVFDHPAVRSAYASDEYIPYWTDLWAAGRMLAKVVLKEPWTKYPDTSEVLEIACGLGLGGIAALSRGLPVTFSDCDATAVRFAVENAKLNGFTQFRSRPLDVRSVPPGYTVPILIGSDLMYEERLVQSLAQFVKAVLAPGGTALITDPDRISARSFAEQAQEAGLRVQTQFVRAGEPGGERTKGTLYRLQHA